jgi:hypothetical protein
MNPKKITMTTSQRPEKTRHEEEIQSKTSNNPLNNIRHSKKGRNN